MIHPVLPQMSPFPRESHFPWFCVLGLPRALYLNTPIPASDGGASFRSHRGGRWPIDALIGTRQGGKRKNMDHRPDGELFLACLQCHGVIEILQNHLGFLGCHKSQWNIVQSVTPQRRPHTISTKSPDRKPFRRLHCFILHLEYANPRKRPNFFTQNTSFLNLSLQSPPLK